MAHSNRRKPNKSNGIRLAAVTMEAITVLAPMAHELMERLPISRSGENSQKKLVSLPSLYDKNNSIELKRAVELLTDYELKAEPVKLYITDARREYKDCFDSQVVDPNFMRPQKIEVGSPVIIRYITQEVIDESRRLDEAKKRKVNLRRHNKRKK